MQDIAIVVAHPDDETLLYGGTIASHKSVNWHIVCVTDGGDGRDGARRRNELESVCGALGAASVQVLGYPDRYRRPIDVRGLVEDLRKRVPEDVDVVLTHAFADVHHHHREVLVACCLAFGDSDLAMFRPSHRIPSQIAIEKHRILRDGYPSQVWNEELLLRYPWCREGADSPAISIGGTFPLKRDLVHEEIWNGLEASGLLQAGSVEQVRLRFAGRESKSRATRLCAKKCIDSALLQAFRNAGVERIAVGRTHHLNQVAALMILLQDLAMRDSLLVYRTKDRDGSAAVSFWVRHEHRVYFAMSPGTLCARDVLQIQGAIQREGVEELWFPAGRYADSIEELDASVEVELGASMCGEFNGAADLWGDW